ncbi:MAG TPA: hypothetical protein VLS49_07390 [Usitatibacter sp.]|nr:hypothetical protein [Usitatibacter sp.]
METDSALAQAPFECFGLPPHVSVEADGSIAPTPPGWNRRNWLLHDAALLGAEALPAPPLAACMELEVVR